MIQYFQMSTGIPEWESLLKHGICSDCGATLDFDDECEDCTRGVEYKLPEWGT